MYSHANLYQVLLIKMADPSQFVIVSLLYLRMKS